MKRMSTIVLAGLLLVSGKPARAQSASSEVDPASQFNESGHLVSNGRLVSFLIRRLPINSFPRLPDEIANELVQRGCLIPQTYEAHRPENVIHASLEHRGSSDWAVLCSAHGQVSLLVFFGSDPSQPMELASAKETSRLQAHGASRILGFNWGIDPASPDQIEESASETNSGPTTFDHDAVSDSVIDQQRVFHYFFKGKWTVLQVAQ